MENKILWSPDQERIESSQLYAFMQEKGFSQYSDLHRFSVENPGEFWNSLFDWFNIISVGERTPHHQDLKFYPYPWFPKVKLNFAENLLEKGKDSDTALIGRHELEERRELTFKELKDQVGSLQLELKKYMGEGDVLAAYMPNIPETVVAMLAGVGLGGVFTSTSSDFGVQGVLDRFGQSAPKVLVTCAAYSYGGKIFDQTEKIKEIIESITSLEKVIIVDFLSNKTKRIEDQRIIYWDDINWTKASPTYLRRDFSADLYIMYSSGTTGKPKCIVHSAGGTLLQHLKELGLHTNMDDKTTLMYFTTCGWMMWNWLVSNLATGGKTVLYEGSPGYPSLGEFVQLIGEEKLTAFGTSPKFLRALETTDHNWKRDFPELKTLMSTGAPLLPEQYDWVYEHFKSDLQIASICGGTDIIGCFMLGNPLMPVKRGMIQCLALGMDVGCFNSEGVDQREVEGELVCQKPFISQPVGFLNDPKHEKFHKAYFNVYENTWHHGDFIQMDPEGSVVVYGRSDATLNPGGVRIGTAEIYRQTEKLAYMEDSLCVGKKTDGDVDVWLFVQMKAGEELTEERIKEIKKSIRSNTTPRHVPAAIKQIQGIPYTRSGKKMELAISRLINGREINNKEAVANPDCLAEYQKLGVS